MTQRPANKNICERNCLLVVRASTTLLRPPRPEGNHRAGVSGRDDSRAMGTGRRGRGRPGRRQDGSEALGAEAGPNVLWLLALDGRKREAFAVMRGIELFRHSAIGAASMRMMRPRWPGA